MNAWKDKVTNKLSRILADSSSSASKYETESPIAESEPQLTARALPKEEPHGSPSAKTVSSYLLSFLPTVHYRSHKRRLDRSLSTSIPDSVQKTSTSPVPINYIHTLMDESSFISPDLYDFLQSSLPNMLQGCRWVLLYSTRRDGISLRTLLRKSVDLPGLCLLIVGDMQGAVFGGLLDGPLKPTSKRKYQGTNQTFVFTTIYGPPRLFRATGANRYYYLCLNDLLAFGGGGSFALHLDEDLLHGTSGPCDTFGNLCLAHSPEFEMKNVELWGFAYSSHYIT